MIAHAFPARIRRMLPFAVLAVFVALCPAPAVAQSVERDVFVTVVDKTDTAVSGLGPKDFIVKEDGRVREVLRVRKATDPMDLAVLVDTSAASSSQISDLREALKAFISRMREHNQIAIVEFGERPRVLIDYTNAAPQLDKGIGRIFSIPNSGAYVMEALAETLKGMTKRQTERAAILMVWLGGREFSTLDDKHVEQLLAEQRAALHVVSLSTGSPADIRTDEGRNRELLFDQGTLRSGGSRRNIITQMALKETLDKVATEMLSQYRVTYARPDTLIPSEVVEVGVTNPALKAKGTPARPVRPVPKTLSKSPQQ